MDTVNVAPKSGALVSPKLTKTKAPSSSSSPSTVAFGCEHLQSLLEQASKLSMTHYSLLQQAIHTHHATISQTCKTSKNPDSRPIPSLKPLFLCLQCPSVHRPEDRDKHYELKRHSFSAESRSGCLYCQQCQDFVYDPALEDIRLQKGRRKRKLDEYDDDSRLVLAHSTFVPCRAIGLRGLYNMGQTCFMSVILQSLIHNPFIKGYYLAEGHKTNECERESCTSCALDEMINEFYSVEKTEGYGAVSMLLGSWMGAQALAGYQQQDAHEYMQFILHNLHLENGGSADQSSDCPCVIHRTFYGKLQSTVTCDKCRNVTTALDPFMDLSLDLRNQVKKRKLDGEAPNTPVKLEDCLERFTGKEKLAEAEYVCRNCGGTQQNATKQLSVERLPPVLSVHLKRFENTKTLSKLETKVRFPLQLDMSPYTTRSRATSSSAAAAATAAALSTSAAHSAVYDLSSVIVHKGKLDSGHYISYSREGNDWFLFDDSKVVLATEAEVLDANAYLLFYIARSFES